MPLFPDGDNGLATSNCVTWVDDLALSIASEASSVVEQVTHMLSLVKMPCWSLDCICRLGLGKLLL